MVVIVCQENGNECDSDLMWGNPALEGLQQNGEKIKNKERLQSYLKTLEAALCVRR